MTGLDALIAKIQKLQTYAMNWQGTEFGGLIERDKVLAVLAEQQETPAPTKNDDDDRSRPRQS